MLCRQLCIGRGFRRTIVTFLLISHKLQLWSWNWIYRPKAHKLRFPTIHLPNGNVKLSHMNRKHFIVGDAKAFPIEKMENKNTKNLPFPLDDVDPIQYSNASAIARTIPNRSSDGRGIVAPVRRKVPIGYNGAPQKYPFLWTDPLTPPPASSLDPSDLWCQMASGSDPRFFHNALEHRPTDRPTDRPWESVTTIARYASNESDAA